MQPMYFTDHIDAGQEIWWQLRSTWLPNAQFATCTQRAFTNSSCRWVCCSPTRSAACILMSSGPFSPALQQVKELSQPLNICSSTLSPRCLGWGRERVEAGRRCLISIDFDDSLGVRQKKGRKHWVKHHILGHWYSFCLSEVKLREYSLLLVFLSRIWADCEQHTLNH